MEVRLPRYKPYVDGGHNRNRQHRAEDHHPDGLSIQIIASTPILNVHDTHPPLQAGAQHSQPPTPDTERVGNA